MACKTPVHIVHIPCLVTAAYMGSVHKATDAAYVSKHASFPIGHSIRIPCLWDLSRESTDNDWGIHLH